MLFFSKHGVHYHHLAGPCPGSGGRLQRVLASLAQYRRPLAVMVAVGAQFLLSSVLWNFFMFHYHALLETDGIYSGWKMISIDDSYCMNVNVSMHLLYNTRDGVGKYGCHP